ncbi:MAG: hypothetical protein ACTHW2_12735 [Tissierella sp.]|uniref:hypothetical protein n=1 Tax=Tissierella sp. TaxID=41274 RepID=UPI003F9C510B
MNRGKVIVPIISFLIFAIFYMYLNYDGFEGFTEYFKSQSFNKIALKYYDDTEFDYISMDINDREIANSTDKEKMNKLISYFKTLEYKRINDDKWYSLQGDRRRIWLSDKNSDTLGIEIYNGRYIRLYLGYIIEEDKGSRVTKIHPNDEYKAYKVLDDKIDIDLIESIYETMEIVED